MLRLPDDNSDLKELLRIIANEESLVLICCDIRGNWEILGHLTHALRTTLDVVLEQAGVTSEQVSKRLRLNASAASNRLRQLYETGLVARKEEVLSNSGGRRFVYSFVSPYFLEDMMGADRNGGCHG